MDHYRRSKIQFGALILAMVAVSGCSSSMVEDGKDVNPPETAADVASATDPMAATTDPVPSAVPDAAAIATDPNAVANAPAPDALDASALDAPIDSAAQPNAVAAAPVQAAPAPVADANSVPDASALDAPQELASAPVTESVATDPMATALADNTAPSVVDSTPARTPRKHKGKKGKKGHKRSEVIAANRPAVSTDGVHYQVKQGDTLMKIAFDNYGDLYRWKEIYEANKSKISDPSHVPPGTQLTLNGAGMVQIQRSGEQYLIKHGDTLGTISKDVYGTNTKWKKLWENNRQLIKDPSKIYAGFYLYYQPEGRMAHGVSEQNSPSASVVPQGVSPGVVAAMRSGAPAKPLAQNDAGTPVVASPDAAANNVRVPASGK